MDLITITFPQWSKWNPRKDIKNPTWFAMSNRITEDDQILTLSDKEFRAFIHLFCLASQQQGHTASVNLVKAERVTGMPKSLFEKSITRLAELEICQIVSDVSRTSSVRDTSVARPWHVRSPSATEQDNTIQDRTEQAPPTAGPVTAPVLNVDSGTAEFLASVKIDIQAAWVRLYEDKTWVEREVRAAVLWCMANPARAPKSDRARFLTNWLKRGWESYRKTLPTKPVPKIVPATGIRYDASVTPGAASDPRDSLTDGERKARMDELRRTLSIAGGSKAGGT